MKHRDWILLALILAITFNLLSIFPDRRVFVFNAVQEYFIEMMLILPAVMILLSLFAVFISKETIVKHLGKTSGVKGILVSIILGALPTGPLYIAFPIAANLLKKGARIANIVIFLSAWACIKVPQEMVEFQFLGAKFMLLRLTLTIVFVIVMGISIEKLMNLRK